MTTQIITGCLTNSSLVRLTITNFYRSLLEHTNTCFDQFVLRDVCREVAGDKAKIVQKHRNNTLFLRGFAEKELFSEKDSTFACGNKLFSETQYHCG